MSSLRFVQSLSPLCSIVHSYMAPYIRNERKRRRMTDNIHPPRQLDIDGDSSNKPGHAGPQLETGRRNIGWQYKRKEGKHCSLRSSLRRTRELPPTNQVSSSASRHHRVPCPCHPPRSHSRLP